MQERQSYHITINHPVYETYKSFDSKADALDWAVTERIRIAEDMGVKTLDLWFDIEEWEEPEHDPDCEGC